MQASDAEHGVVDAVALEAAVAQDRPALHAGEAVLDAGPDAFCGSGWFFILGGQVLALGPAVRDNQAGALVAAVGDGHGLADGVLGAGFLPAARVVPDAGQRLGDHDDQPGVGVDDDLVGCGVAVVLRPLCDRAVPSGDQSRPR